MKNWRNWIVIAVLVAYVILFWSWASLGYPTQIAVCEVANGTEKCAAHYVPVGIIRWVLFQLDRYGVLLTAIFTGFIAWFTWTLRQSTEKMWVETKKGTDALSVVERAYVYPIIVSPGAIEACIENALVFYLDDLTKDDVPATETAELTFKFKNFGKTPAVLKNAFVGFGVATVGALIGVSLPESVLASLEETGLLTSKMQVGITRRQAQHILVYTAHICFEGHVTFDDIWGNEHTTEFYFVWDKETKRMTLRWVETETKQKGERPQS